MIGVDEPFDRSLRAALLEDAAEIIPDNTTVAVRIRMELAGRKRTRRVGSRLVFVLAAVVGTLVLASGVALATGSLTAPIRFVFTPPSNGTNPGGVVNVNSCYQGGPTTLGQARSTVPYHVFAMTTNKPVSSSIAPTGVGFTGGCGPKSSSPANRGVLLTYVVSGTPIQLDEGSAADPNGPLTIHLKAYARGGPQRVVTIDGSQYAVWMESPTPKFPCAAGVSLAAWQIGNTVIYLTSNYENTSQSPQTGACINDAIPWQTFLTIVHGLR
jgi:hypothetical protein